MARKTKSFEQAMNELEEITKSLESGSLTLDESIKHYKKGMELSAFCNTILKNAEQEIYVLNEHGFEKVDGDCTDD